jgi:hypothetical protein
VLGVLEDHVNDDVCARQGPKGPPLSSDPLGILLKLKLAGYFSIGPGVSPGVRHGPQLKIFIIVQSVHGVPVRARYDMAVHVNSRLNGRVAELVRGRVVRVFFGFLS